ncbi:MAG: GDP-mannose 4,6-dehydratase [Parcubacteria group bacterium]
MNQGKETILVTGGAGFIGSHLSKKLMDLGYQIVIVDNFNSYYDPSLKERRISELLKGYNFKLYREDIKNARALRKIFLENKIDKICHLAAQAGVRYSLIDPFIYEESNVRGTLNLLELAREFRIKGFIFASSSSVYGASKKIPFKESDPIDKPISVYAATKKAGEALVFSYHHLYKISATVLRFFSVYGPFWRPDLALCKFATLIHNDKPIEVYNFGKMQRDFTYIDDIVNGIVVAVKKNYPWGIFNLGRGKAVQLTKFITLIEKEMGKKASKKMLPMQPGDIGKVWSDISSAKKKLNYRPKTGIAGGVKKTIDWYKDYLKI